jgi:hypothetical protein
MLIITPEAAEGGELMAESQRFSAYGAEWFGG